MLKVIKKQRAYEGIVKQLRQLIEKGRLKRGDQIPSERELSDTLKVSRTTVREAINTLETMKLVDRRHGDGTYVIASNEEALIQPLATYLFHEKDDLIDIFHVRKIIEPEIARLATENATTDEIEELEGIIREQEKRMTVEMDTEFHRSLARMARNKILERFSTALMDQLGKTREKYFRSHQRKTKSFYGHLDIFKAIKSRNSRTAQKAMILHLEAIERMVFKRK